MMTFYAAIGTYRIRTENGHKVPYIQKLGKLYPISIPEFVIWSTLLWEVMTYDELKKHYDEQIRELKGNRPSFIAAGAPKTAEALYEYMIAYCKQTVPVVEHGVFGADMQVSLCNDGPFTIVLDSDEIVK